MSGARVILAATCYADAMGALDLCVTLTRVLPAHLHGLIVEDEAIARYAALPMARVLAGRGPGPSVTPDAMHAAFARDARAFRARLAQAVGARGGGDGFAGDWSFEHVQGRLPALLGAMAQAGDLVVIGFGRPVVPARGLVVLVESAEDMDHLPLALRLAHDLHLGISVLTSPELAAQVRARVGGVPGGVSGGVSGGAWAAAAGRMSGQGQGQGQGQGPKAAVAEMAEVIVLPDAGARLARLGRMAARLVLAGRGWAIGSRLDALQTAARCPLLLAG